MAGHSEENQAVVTLLLEHVLRRAPRDDRDSWPPAWAQYRNAAVVQAERLRVAAEGANDCASSHTSRPKVKAGLSTEDSSGSY